MIPNLERHTEVTQNEENSGSRIQISKTHEYRHKQTAIPKKAAAKIL